MRDHFLLGLAADQRIDQVDLLVQVVVVQAMDDAVGRVLQTVSDLGEEENTLIVFLSDNGGPTWETSSSNGPLRGFKGTTHEGGIRVPFCMKWKGQIPEGLVYRNPVIQLDIVPTVMAAAGAPVSAVEDLDGVDLLPYLTGEVPGRPHQTLYWRYGKQWAIRDGDDKLVVSAPGPGRAPAKRPHLYDLSKDLGESRDLMTTRPVRAASLKALWDSWSAKQARPFPSR